MGESFTKADRYLKAQLAPEVAAEEPKPAPAEGGDSLAAELAARVCSRRRRGRRDRRAPGGGPL